jgi:hypothetical protein
MPKVSGIGSNLSLTPTYEAPIKLNEIQGNTLQDGTPTPDTPVEIQSVTGLQKVNITGKNLFNFNTFISSSNMVVIDSSSSNSLVARVTQASTWATVRYRIFNLKENTNYSLKYDFENSYNSELYKHTWVVVRNPITGDNIYNDSYYKNDVVTFNTGDNKYLDLIFQVTINAPAVINTLTITNIQLEQGSTATEYEPYKGNTYKVNLGKNLLDADTIIPAMINSQSYSSGTLVYDNVTKTLTMTNPNTDTYLPAIWGNANYISGINIDVEKNTTYTFRFTASQPDNTLKNAVFGLNKSTNKYEYIKTLSQKSTYTFNTGNYDVITFRLGSTSTTGTVTVFSNFQLEKGSQATSYSPYFTPIELNKIGDYQDRIYKDNGKWYVEKNIEKIDMSTIDSWGKNSNGKFYRANFKNAYNVKIGQLYSNIFSYETTAWSSDYKIGITSQGNLWITTGDTTLTDINNVPTWLGNKNAIMYGILSSPTYTEITNTELIEDLETLYTAKSQEGTTNISITSEDLEMILNVSALKSE